MPLLSPLKVVVPTECLNTVHVDQLTNWMLRSLTPDAREQLIDAANAQYQTWMHVGMLYHPDVRPIAESLERFIEVAMVVEAELVVAEDAARDAAAIDDPPVQVVTWKSRFWNGLSALLLPLRSSQGFMRWNG